jgi:branched-chain amino acid transport system substrate-binding protein
MIGVDSIKRAGGTDKEKIRAAVEGTKGYVWTGGIFNISASDHMGLDLAAFRLLEIGNGKWSLVQSAS